MGGKGGDIPQVPPGLVEAAGKSAEAATLTAKTAKEFLAWYKPYAEKQTGEQGRLAQANLGLMTRVTNDMLGQSEEMRQRGGEQYAHYTATFKPIERMGALDALGAQYMSDEQLAKITGGMLSTEIAAYQKKPTEELAELRTQRDKDVKALDLKGWGKGGDKRIAMEKAVAIGSDISILKDVQKKISGSPTQTWEGRNYIGKEDLSKEEIAVLQKHGFRFNPDNDLLFSYDKKKKDKLGGLVGDLKEESSKLIKDIELPPGTDIAKFDPAKYALDLEDKRTKINTDFRVEYTKTKAGMKAGLAGIRDQWANIPGLYEAEREIAQQAAQSVGAAADVAAQTQQTETAKQMLALGIDPRSGQSAGLKRGLAAEAALGTAGAMNQARTATLQAGTAMRGGVMNFGRNMPNTTGQFGQIANQGAIGASGIYQGAVGTSMDAARYGPAAGLQGYQAFGNMMNQAQAGYGQAGSLYGDIYSGGVNAYGMKGQQQAGTMSAIGSGLGLIGGIALLA